MANTFFVRCDHCCAKLPAQRKYFPKINNPKHPNAFICKSCIKQEKQEGQPNKKKVSWIRRWLRW